VPAARRLKFSSDNTFHAEVRRRVTAHLRETGRRERDCLEMYLKTALIFGSFAASYVLLVFFASAWWQAAILGAAVGLCVVAIGFNVMHDASHGAYSDRPAVNRLMALSLDLVGGSSAFWHWKHGVFHHTFVNVAGYDTDISFSGLGRLTPHEPRTPVHRWQHWYVWLLYAAIALKWHLFDDFRVALTGRIGPHAIPRLRGRDLAIFVAGKLTFWTIAFGVPLLLHPFWVVASVYVLAAAVTGIVLSTVFQLAHVVEHADFPLEVSPGHIDNAWAIHQVETTVDFARDSSLASHLLGGLNYQIEHHLFPRICHVNYRAIAPIVERTCAEFGVRYNHNATVLEALRSHFRWLRRMGAAPAAI
jgi:linoleoyl-CoA desaturase